MFSVNVIVYPWDFEDEGVDRVLDRLQGEIGSTDVTVPVATGPVRHLRRHGEVGARVFQSRGGFFFPPDANRYGNTRLRPIVSGWLKARNPLRKISEACHARDVRMHISMHTRRVERLAFRHPRCAAKSAFGDTSRTRVCVHHPDAAELFRAAVDDVRDNYAPFAMQFPDLGRPHETDLIDPMDVRAMGRAGAELLAICCCESCRQEASAAGIDTNAAIHELRTLLRDAIDHCKPLDVYDASSPEESEPLRAYIANRRAAHAGFVDSLKRSAGRDCAMHLERADDVETLGQADRLIVKAAAVVSLSDDDFGAWHSTVRRSLPTQPLEACISVRDYHALDSAALVKTAKWLADRSFSGVTFDHYALMVGRDFTAAKQAARYARRTAVV